MKLFVLLQVFILLLVNKLSAQDTVVALSGKLLRLNINEQEIDYSNAFGAWEDAQIRKYDENDGRWDIRMITSGYFDIIKTRNNNYLLKYVSESPGLGLKYYLENMETKEIRLYGGKEVNLDDNYKYTLFEPHVVGTTNGYWILNGYYGNAFLSNEDSLYVCPPTGNFITSASFLFLEDIIGQVDDKYVGVFYNSQLSNYQYYKIDLSRSPYLDTADFEPLYYKFRSNENEKISEILQLDSSLFLLKFDDFWGYYIYTLIDNQFKHVKDPDPFIGDMNYYNDNKYKNGRLYFAHSYSNTLRTYQYDATNQSISLIKEDLYTYIDKNYNYAYYVSDYPVTKLKIYDLNEGKYIDSTNYGVEIERDDYPCDIIVDSPYIYLHQVLYKIIDIADDINENTNLTYKLSVYPNPFNPQTTIAFTIPNAGKVELAVYDLLGRKVTELLNEYRDKGSYEVKFNGSNLASGIYFYTIKAGSFVKTEKLMLLK